MKKAVVLLILITIVALDVLGQATANSDGNWSNTGSWQGGNIGDGGETVSMNANIDLVIQAGESFTISSLNVGKTGSITINSGGTLILNGPFIADKEFTINVAGLFTVNGNITVQKDLVLNVTGTMDVDGSIDMAKDAALTIDGSLGVTGSVTSAQNTTVTVNGDFTIGGNLDLGTGSQILGTGPVDTGGCTGAACGDEQLPVELISFEVTIDNQFIVINWSTLSEEDNDFFTVERSPDGVAFDAVGVVAGNGTTTEQNSYQFVDQSPFIGVSYYRLRQTDYDGNFEVFEIKMVHHTTIDQLSVYPNPSVTGESIRIITGAMPEEAFDITVYDQSGKVVQQFAGSGNRTNYVLDQIDRKGIYLLRLTSGSVVKTQRLVLK